MSTHKIGFKITNKFNRCTSCDSLSDQRKKYQGKWCADLKQVPFYCNACLAQKLGFENEMEEVIYDQSVEDLVENEREVDDQNVNKSVEEDIYEQSVENLVENEREVDDQNIDESVEKPLCQ